MRQWGHSAIVFSQPAAPYRRQEQQATDRAFRIGQLRNVFVHKFLCAGTLEEKIDAMIERKRALAETIVGTGEDWMTRLSTAELRDLFALRPGAVADQ